MSSNDDARVREMEREFRATVIAELRSLGDALDTQGTVLSQLQTSSAVYGESQKHITKDVTENKGSISKLKSDNLKMRGAGVLAGFIISAKFLWEGLIK